MNRSEHIRNEFAKGLEKLDYELLTHQYHDDDIVHYYDDSNPLYPIGLIVLKPDAHPSKKHRDRSIDKLEIKLAVRDALDQEERERKNPHLLSVLSEETPLFPRRKIYYDEPYFNEGRFSLDELLDTFLGMFSNERSEDRATRRQTRIDVLEVLREMRKSGQ